MLLILLTACLTTVAYGDECHLTPVIHVLQYPGCIPKPIPSFACTGRCTSYVQVGSTLVLWGFLHLYHGLLVLMSLKEIFLICLFVLLTAQY